MFKTPWPGDPRVNIQNEKGRAKPYQVKQVLKAIDKLHREDTMTVDTRHYTYRVAWSPEDGEFVGTCLEFPSLSWLAKSTRAALAGIERHVGDVVADLEANGEPVPEPLAERRYSGTFNVRIPSELHRRLAAEAAEQGISLNRLVSQRLAS